MSILIDNEDLDEMQHNSAFHQGLHCMLRLKQSSGTEIHHNLKNYILKYTMDSPILIVSMCMGNLIRTQFVIRSGTR